MMLDIKVDTKDLDRLADGITKFSRNVPTNEVNKLLRKNTRGMFRRLQKEVPVSRSIEYTNSRGKLVSSSVEYINIKRVRNKKNANAYRQGGAMRRDLRVKSVPPRGGEIGRVVLGVSKRSGKVGWRTGFNTGGTKLRRTKKGANRGRMKKNDFLTKAFTAEIENSSTGFARDFRGHFEGWALRNLPQNYK